ncbi:MAG: GTP-binding protein, partial [Bacilli bacterium]
MQPIPSQVSNVVIIGDVNSGKSSLINFITQQDVSIVSSHLGTTTDEVIKRFELLNSGMINLIDTAGYNDQSPLGQQRIAKTNKVLQRAHLVVKVLDVKTY